MAESKKAAGHESTWGASTPVKENWTDKNAEPVRKAVERENAKKEAGDE